MSGNRRRLFGEDGWIDRIVIPVLAFAVGLALAAGLGALISLATPWSETAGENGVESTVKTFLGAVGRDSATACAQLSRDAQAELERHEETASCERAANTTVRYPDLAQQFDFGAIDYGPNHQSAQVPSRAEVAPHQLLAAIDLEQSDGQWHITQLNWYFER